MRCENRRGDLWEGGGVHPRKRVRFKQDDGDDKMGEGGVSIHWDGNPPISVCGGEKGKKPCASG